MSTHENFPGIFAGVSSISKHVVKIIWSGFYFALAFILVNYFDNFITAFFAALLDHKPVFSYDGVKPIAQALSPWTANRVAVIYLTSPLICLIISSILLFGLYNSYSTSHLSLFIFWLSLNTFALFYSYFFTGIIGAGKYTSIFYTGYALYLSWLYMSPQAITILLTISILLFSFTAFLFVKPVLRFTYSNSLLKTKQGYKVFYINIILLPFIIGVALVAFITYPMCREYQFIRMFSLVVLLFMMFIATIATKKKSASGTIYQKGGIRHLSPFILIIAIALLTYTVRYLLSNTIEL